MSVSAFLRPLIIPFMLLAMVLPVHPHAAARSETQGPYYVLLSKLRLGVRTDVNHQFRILELEVWLAYDDARDADRVGRVRASVGEAMKEDFLGYSWEAFADPVEGPELARTIVQSSVRRALPDVPGKANVLIRGMTLR